MTKRETRDLALSFFPPLKMNDKQLNFFFMPLPLSLFLSLCPKNSNYDYSTRDTASSHDRAAAARASSAATKSELVEKSLLE